MIGQTFPKVEIRPRKADGTSMTAEQAATVKAGDAVRYGKLYFTCLEIQNGERGPEFRLNAEGYDSPWFAFQLCGKPPRASTAAVAA